MVADVQIEAAARGICAAHGLDPDGIYAETSGPMRRWRQYTNLARAALTAAEEAEAWSENDADLIEAATDMLDRDEGWSDLSPVEMDRLLHLARCGAGRA